MLRQDLLAVVEPLLDDPQEPISLDRLAEALGTLAVSSEEIDEMITWLESRGRSVGQPPTGPNAETLQTVLVSARMLKVTTQRTPNATEVAEHSGLELAAVQRALFFAKILQR